MTFRKFHITPNNSFRLFTGTLPLELNTRVGVGKGERERRGGGDSDLSLMSLGFSVIILNQGWYNEQCIILIVFRMIYSSSHIHLSSLHCVFN